MEVVYFFCEFDVVRVPLFGYERDLFRRLAARGGVWEWKRQQFIFRRNTSVNEFIRVFTDTPCVWVEANSPIPFKMYNFWERLWEEFDVEYFEEQNKNNCMDLLCDSLDTPEELSGPFGTNDIMRNHIPLSENFPERWRLKLEEELGSRKYSLRTQRSYVYYNRLICQLIQKPPEEIHGEDITRFLAIVERNKGYSASSINLAISAIKFFHKTVLKDTTIGEQYRPNQDKRLPMVLARTEIHKILGMEKNLKHRLLLTLVYSSGLRVSEVVALKREHIDLSRRVIYVRLGKGRKDRCTILSEKAARLISEYYTLYDIQTWLFPGQPPVHPLAIRSAQKIFDKAVQHAKIQKEVSIHSLRHTFATHLLENGTDIRYIQALLGHSSLRTTERYTHIAQRNILNIQSPLDTIL